MRKSIKTIIVLVTILLSSFYAQAQYVASANPFKQVKEAQVVAKSTSKHILVMIGGDWCIWCKRFDALVKSDTNVNKVLHENYIFVHVSHTKDVPNWKFLKKYQQPQRMGFPVFLVLDAKGKLLHTQNSAYLETQTGEKGHDPKLVIEFLNHWKSGYHLKK